MPELNDLTKETLAQALVAAAHCAPASAVYDHLSLNGAGAVINWAVNGASTPQQFRYVADAETEIHRIIWYIEDGGQFSADNFGGLGTPLTKGVLFKVLDSDGTTVLNDLLAGDPIKNNLGFHAQSFDAEYIAYGNGNNVVVAEWTLDRDLGGPLLLTAGQMLQLTVQDNLSTLVNCQMYIRGRLTS